MKREGGEKGWQSGVGDDNLESDNFSPFGGIPAW